MLQFLLETETCSNSEADTSIIGVRLPGEPRKVDMQMLIHRLDQTAHISLQLLAISKSGETKLTECALCLRRAPPHVSLLFFRCWRVRRVGEGVFTAGARGPQELFWGNMTFFSHQWISTENQRVGAIIDRRQLVPAHHR